MNKNECIEHKPNMNHLTLPQEIIPEIVDDDHIEFIVDVLCEHCGTSGSFSVRVQLADINW